MNQADLDDRLDDLIAAMKQAEADARRLHLLIFCIVGLILFGVLIAVLAWASPSRATEYSQISEANLTYCDTFARRSAVDMAGMNEAYGDCIRILPTRLPMPKEQGTVPASDRKTDASWSAACEAEYRTWDAATGTVIRRGSPDRVECPLVLRDGEWTLP